MILYALGLAAAALALFVLWLLGDGVRALLARRRAEARARAARRPVRLRVSGRQDHTPDLFTLTLAHPDGKRLPGFTPGQFLSLRVPAGENAAPLARRYSLGAWTPRPREYRLGVRRVEGGRVSGWLHVHAMPGVELEALPPAGEFALRESRGEVVLVGAGIGVTPMAAMVDALAARPRQAARVWLFHAARELAELVDSSRYAELERTAPWFRHRPWLTRPQTDWRGGRGRLTAAELVKDLADPRTADYYLCARQDMMDELAAGLMALGVPAAAIHWESFGGASGNADAREYQVAIDGHGSHVFQGEPSLLHALEAWGMPIAADCRAGECGACRVRIERGVVRACQPQQTEVPAGYALACCAVPAADLEIAL